MPHDVAAQPGSFPDFTGRTVENGRLQLLDVLGSGAYGKVYRAVDLTSPEHHRIYHAVKCLFRPVPGSREEQFQQREFALHAKVSSHSNVVTFHRYFYEKQYVFVVLDLCEGGDLFTVITEYKAFSDNDHLIRALFLQLIDAVNFCHESSVYHRDLKPENVLCSNDGLSIFLADFGLSTHKRVSNEFGCGSSYYMSPECIGKEFKVPYYSTRQSDIWSLGIILVNMMTGRNPWRWAMTTDEGFAEYLRAGGFLREVLPISNDACRVLQRIFNPNPSARISLPNLREEIVKIRTFFMTDEELSLATPRCQQNAKSYEKKIVVEIPSPAILESITDAFACESTKIGESSDGSSSSVPVNIEDTALETLTTSNDSSDASLSSVADSEGPITPATHAQDPPVEVPDMPEEENLGPRTSRLGKFIKFPAFSSPLSKIVQGLSSHRSPSNTDVRPPPRRIGNQLFKKVTQRLYPISTSSASS